MGDGLLSDLESLQCQEKLLCPSRMSGFCGSASEVSVTHIVNCQWSCCPFHVNVPMLYEKQVSELQLMPKQALHSTYSRT